MFLYGLLFGLFLLPLPSALFNSCKTRLILQEESSAPRDPQDVDGQEDNAMVPNGRKVNDLSGRRRGGGSDEEGPDHLKTNSRLQDDHIGVKDVKLNIHQKEVVA